MVVEVQGGAEGENHRAVCHRGGATSLSICHEDCGQKVFAS